MCNNPLNSRALNWRSPANIAGIITLDGQFRPVSNFLLSNPGTANLAFSNLLPGAIYRFVVNATNTTAVLTLPANTYFNGGSTINLTFTGNQWHVFHFSTDGSTVLVVAVGAQSQAGNFAQLDQDNTFNQVKLTGFKADIKSVGDPTYTFLDIDTAKIIRFNNAAGCTATLRNNHPVGWMVTCEQSGASKISFVLEGGATLNNRSGHAKTAGQYAVISVYCATNVAGNNAVFVLSGDTGT